MRLPLALLPIGVLVLAVPGLAALERNVPRIVIRGGQFCEKGTGKLFTPLGVNYYRVGKFKSGQTGHATFCPGFYDRAFIEKMMARCAALGFNTVRTFHAFYIGDEGILISPHAREIAPGYLANVIHFLRQARKNGLHVVFSWDTWKPDSEWWSSKPLPDEAKYHFRTDWDQAMGVNNFRVNLGSVRTRANSIVALIEAIREQDPTLLPVVLAWELENEVYFVADQSPFNSRQGTFRLAGRDYLLSSDDETQRLMDDMIRQWASAIADTIHRADPEALVSADVFPFAGVGRIGPGALSKDHTTDGRIPARPVALLRSGVDFIDIHLYAWTTDKESVADFLSRSLASDEWDRLQPLSRRAGKPIMVGETGVFGNYLRKPPDWKIDHDFGLECFREQVRGLKERGFAGALYWPYGSPDSSANDENPAIALFPRYAEVLRDTWGRR